MECASAPAIRVPRAPLWGIETMPLHRTAAILVIGNEILSGKVTDENSPFLARELRSLGVSLRRIEVVTDEVGEIAEAVARMSGDFDFVFTSGGVGPTHDDKTVEGIAQGLGQRIVRHPLLEELLRHFYGEKLTDAALRMADVPESAQVLFGGTVKIPVVTVANITVLPGVPEFFRKEFLSVRERFASDPFYCRRAFVMLMEGEIVDILNDITRLHQEVELGSYPVFNKDVPYRVMLTFDSKSEQAAESALALLLERLPAASIYRVE